MENDRYQQEQSPHYDGQFAPQAGFQYTPPTKEKHKKSVTWTQLIVALLVVGLMSGGLSALIVGSAYGATQETVQSGDNGTQVIPPSESNSSASDSTPSSPATAPSSGIQMSGASGTTAEYDSTTVMLQNAMASVVGIYMEQTAYGINGETTTEDTGSGSGVIITSDGYIVTNYHVISGASGLKVYLQDGKEYTGTVVGSDSMTDLAVIKIDATNLPAATLGTSGDILVGESVYAIGNPLGVFTSSVSRGIVSGLNRTIEVEGQSMTLLQTDASVNPGNSGGGLFNAIGELVGIVNAKSKGLDVEGLGFAIPIDDAKPVVIDLIDLGYVSGRPFLGITLKEINLVESSGSGQGGYFPFYMPSNYVTRIQVMSVMEGSSAEAAGMLVDDIILSVNGTEINGSSQLAAALYEYKIGDVVTITVQRGEANVDLSVTLAERPAS